MNAQEIIEICSRVADKYLYFSLAFLLKTRIYASTEL